MCDCQWVCTLTLETLWSAAVGVPLCNDPTGSEEWPKAVTFITLICGVYLSSGVKKQQKEDLSSKMAKSLKTGTIHLPEICHYPRGCMLTHHWGRWKISAHMVDWQKQLVYHTYYQELELKDHGANVLGSWSLKNQEMRETGVVVFVISALWTAMAVGSWSQHQPGPHSEVCPRNKHRQIK